MAPPDAEWLLWAKRFHTEHHSLLQRFTTVEKSARQRQELVQDNQKTLDHLEALARANSALKESNLNLEKDVGVLKKIVQRTQDEMKLTNSEHQKSLAELDATIKRVGRLESAMDQIASDQKGEVLQKQQGVLQGQIDRLTQEVNWWRSEATAASERLESRVLSRRLKNRPGKALKGKYRSREKEIDNLCIVSRSLSQATTTADTVDMNDTEARRADILQEEIKGLAQGQFTLEEYFAYCKDLMGRAGSHEENNVVRAFVAGIRDKVTGIPLQDVLNEKGWTWDETRAEMERVITNTQKIMRTKRYIVRPEGMDAYMKIPL